MNLLMQIKDTLQNSMSAPPHQEKISYAVIVGDKEIEENTLSIRDHTGMQKHSIPADDFKGMVLALIHTKSRELWAGL